MKEKGKNLEEATSGSDEDIKSEDEEALLEEMLDQVRRDRFSHCSGISLTWCALSRALATVR